MANKKGNPNIKEQGAKTRFTKQTASDAGKKSAEKRRSKGRLMEYLLMYAAMPNKDDPKKDNEEVIAYGIIEKALEKDAKGVDQFAQYTGQNIIKVEANERVTPALNIGEMGGEDKEE